MTQVVAGEAGLHLHGAEWFVVLGAALVLAVALAVAGVLIFGVPVLGLPPTGIHLGHRSKRLAAVTTLAVVLLVAGFGLAVNRNPVHDNGPTRIAAGTTTAPPGVSNDPGTSGTTGTTRTSTRRPPGTVTTGPQPSGPGLLRRSKATTSVGDITPLGHTPTTARRPPGRHPTETTAPRHRTTTTTRPHTTTTTEPPTTTTTEPPTTTTTEPPTTTTPPLVGDINLDGMVGCMDESLLVPEIGELGSGLAGDLNHDGTVDTSDLNIMLANWTGDGTTWINPLDPLQTCL